MIFALTLPSLAQEEKRGKVSFQTSCDPKVQAWRCCTLSGTAQAKDASGRT